MRRFTAGLVLVALAASACGGDDPAAPAVGAGGTGLFARPPSTVEGARRPLEIPDPRSTPPLDTARHAVPLDEIVFDTFAGASIRLPDAEPALIADLFDAIVPLDAPDYESATQARSWLDDADVVVGYVDDEGGAWAFPVRILNFHEIVNDELGGRPVLVSYCPLCASGIVYDRRVDGRELWFSNTSALHENDLVMVDRETGSYWWQVAGRAIVGPLTGTSLTPLAARTERWGPWRERHPDTAVLSRPVPGRYGRDPFVGYAESVDAGRTPFPVSREALEDGRLTPGTTVVVFDVGGRTWAAPVVPAGTRVVDLDGATVEVTTDGVGGEVRLVGGDGTPGDEVAVRTTLWFAAVAAFADVTLVGGG